MHVGIATRHPEHVRFFRHPIEELQAEGIEVSVYAREHGPTIELLDQYGLDYHVLAGSGSTPAELLAGHVAYEARLLAAARRHDVSVLASVGGRAVSHLAPLAGARSVVFLDWQPGVTDRLVGALAHTVCTPAFLTPDVSSRSEQYAGFHELSHLHPDRFDSDPDAVRRLGLDPDERLFVLGFLNPTVEAGTGSSIVETLHERLSGYGAFAYADEHVGSATPSVTAATPDGGTGATIPPADRADVLAHADLCLGDSGLLATEAAVLGTPSVLLWDDRIPTRIAELSDRYGLLHATADGDEFLEQVAAVATDPGAEELWVDRRDRLIAETTDVAGRVADVLRQEAMRGA